MQMLKGKVIKGDGIGRKRLDSPTANLDIRTEEVGLKEGVYAAWVILNKKKYVAALVILPKINKVEVRLIDYQGEDFYGEDLEVEVVEKISEILDLALGERLKKKIGDDIEKVKKILKK